jgi:hypothetical protein
MIGQHEFSACRAGDLRSWEILHPSETSRKQFAISLLNAPFTQRSKNLADPHLSQGFYGPISTRSIADTASAVQRESTLIVV